jgi:hypothetical protein
MFQKNSIMSLKKKSKSMGQLTALGSPSFGRDNSGNKMQHMKKQTSHKNFNMSDKLKFLNHGYTSNNNNGDPRTQVVPPTRSTTALNLGTPKGGIKTTTPKVRQSTRNCAN